MAKKSPPALKPEIEPRQLLRYIAWIFASGGWLLVALALASYDPADWPGHAIAPYNQHVHNWVGRIGSLLAHQIYLMVGPGVWIFMFAVLFVLINTARRAPITQPALRLTGVIIMSLTVSAMVGLGMPNFSNRPEGSGGLVAYFINTELTDRFNSLGTFIILLLFFWTAAILAMDQVVLALPKLVGKTMGYLPRINVPKPVLVGRFPTLPRLWGRPDEGGSAESSETRRSALRSGSRKGRLVLDNREGAIDENAGGPGATEYFDPDEPANQQMDDSAEERDDTSVAVADDEEDETDVAESDSVGDDDAAGALGADAPGAYIAEKRQFDPEALRARIRQLPINFAPRAKAGAKLEVPGAAGASIDLEGYAFPPIDLLMEPQNNFTEEMERMVKDQAIQLESAMQQYRIEGNVVGIDSGPVITLYEVRLAAGTKVAALAAVSSDLARALKSHNIRIVPNMAGKDTVGIEVPNLVKEQVRLKELMTTQGGPASRMNLPMFLGKDASGNPLIADLGTMPHMLIAGTTGSGKSVCMNSIIMSFMFTKRPDELKMVLVDPKMVEMSLFKDIPHLMCPVVTEMAKAAAILEWATTKMDERYELLAEAGVRDVAGYNALGWEELKERFKPASEAEEARIPKKLPFLVFIVDELADLMMTNKEVEGFIVRLAQKSRAVGMHLILATQRPQANVVTGLIKSNMPCRVSFKVASGMDSRIVLDQKGAELLLGQGDMLYLSPRTSKLTRAQGTLVDDLEIRRSVKFLKEIAQQNFEPQLVQLRSPGGEEDPGEERDPLFDDAVRIVLQTKRGSVSLLQRRLTIGYSRASRLIEQMAQAGLLGDYKGSQAREVTITLEEWEAIRAQAEADAAIAAENQAKDGAPQSDESSDRTISTEDVDDDPDAVPDELDGEYKE